MPAASSLRSASTSADAPPTTGRVMALRCGSVDASPAATGASTSTASASRSPSLTVTSSRSPPTWALSSSAVPRAITRPWSITTMVSASTSASSRYCVVSSSVVPAFTRFWITSHISIRERGSSPVVGSSRNSTGGLATSAPARSRRRRMPPEYVLAGRSAASSRRNAASSSRARSRALGRPRWYSRPIIWRFSNPVRYSSTAAYWPDRPIRRRTSRGSASTSTPATVALPRSGRSRVDRIRTTVVLPAPLGPSSPSTVPEGTDRSTPARATTSPYRLTSPEAVMASVMARG